MTRSIRQLRTPLLPREGGAVRIFEMCGEALADGATENRAKYMPAVADLTSTTYQQDESVLLVAPYI